MTGMEHAIEKVANALHGDQCAEDPDPGERCSCGADDFYRQAEVVLDTLREAGLLAPAPMSEEWTVMGEYESGDDWVIDVEFATRLGAEDFLARNEWASDDGGYVARRLMTDWLPADEAD